MTTTTLHDWLTDVAARLAKIGLTRADMGRQHWDAWHRNGLTAEQAFREACADQCVSPLTGAYSAAAHAAKEGINDDDSDLD